mmetsp:Transcript_10413/g.25551  ORF Transcript_10413/g.25551 Transcript_10413/m.25551 type:complete len:205 (+) Transcript_10413:1265-1879(+)
MAAVGQVQAHDAVVRGQHCGVHAEVGGGARQHLDVDAPLVILEAVRRQRAGLAQRLDLVDELVSTVVALAWQTFGVFVGQATPVDLHHGARSEVLGRDELQAGALAGALLHEDGIHLGVKVFDASVGEGGGTQGEAGRCGFSDRAWGLGAIALGRGAHDLAATRGGGGGSLCGARSEGPGSYAGARGGEHCGGRGDGGHRDRAF